MEGTAEISQDLAVFIGSLTSLSCHLSGLLLRDRHRRRSASWRQHTLGIGPHGVTTTMANLLEDWCRGMEADIHRSLVVHGASQRTVASGNRGDLEWGPFPAGPVPPYSTRIFEGRKCQSCPHSGGWEGVNLRAIPGVPRQGGIWRWWSGTPPRMLSS